MSKMLSGTCLLLAFVLVVGMVDAARFPSRAELERIESNELLKLGALEETWKLPEGATYKNTKPLIGIMTQPCHDCAGIRMM